METKKAFQDDVYLSKCQSKVVAVKENAIALDKTIIFPEGGGQSSDIAKINNYSTTFSYEEGSLIWHEIGDHKLKPKDHVLVSLDWNHRFDNMQRHCGEHIMSGMWHREYGGVNKGFHMGDNYMTIDISLEDNEKYTEKPITMAMALHVQDCTNEAIWSNLPVITRRFKYAIDANNLPLRKPLDLEENISIVSVGNINNPSDCVACCGTHPAFSSEVGLVKIYKVEKNKSFWRIYFEAGKRAVEDYNKKSKIISEIANGYSCSIEYITKKIQANNEAFENKKRELNSLYSYMIEDRKTLISQNSKASNKPYVFKETLLDSKNIMILAKSLSKEISNLCVIKLKEENSIVLISNGSTHNCKDIAVVANSKFGAKGGGGPTSCRLSFDNPGNLKSFIDYIQ